MRSQRKGGLDDGFFAGPHQSPKLSTADPQILEGWVL